MININKTIKRIQKIESLLAKSKHEKLSVDISLNDTDWLKNTKKQSLAFQKEHTESIQSITSELIEAFIKSQERDRRVLWEELSKTEFLKSHIEMNRAKEGTDDWFFDELIVIIIRDLGNDWRDGLLEINELIKKAKKYSYDIKSIIGPLSKLANTENTHGQKWECKLNSVC